MYKTHFPKEMTNVMYTLNNQDKSKKSHNKLIRLKFRIPDKFPFQWY